MAKQVFEPESLNGTYYLKPADDGTDGHFLRCQWYPGVGAYYVIFDDNPGAQGSMSINKLKKFLKEYKKDDTCE